jgi:hypothetical protein
MRWMVIAVLFASVGCASGSYEVGPDATREIKEVMRSGNGGEAALLAGEDAYLLDAGALDRERRALLDALVAKRVYYGLALGEFEAFTKALLAKDRQALEAYRDRFEPEEFEELLGGYLEPRAPVGFHEEPAKGVQRFVGNRILEIAYPEGTLRIARFRGDGVLSPRYAVAFARSPHAFGRRDATFATFRIRATPGIEAAWQGLERSAAAQGSCSVLTDASGPFKLSALAHARELAQRG